MATGVSRVQGTSTARVALAVEDRALADQTAQVLARRGIACERVALADAAQADARAIGVVPAEPIGPTQAADLAPVAARAAAAGRPLVVLAAFPRAIGVRGEAQAAALAYLRAYGAVLCTDPDAWLEALVLLAAWGAPAGPRVAVIAPSGSWISGSAQFLASEAAAAGGRAAALTPDAARVGPTDVVLVDRDEAPTARAAMGERTGGAAIVPLLGRAELCDERPALVGLRPALAAVAACGRLRERVRLGLGPASVDEVTELEVDSERFQRQLAKIGTRAGDHETKVLLAAWGVPVTRQAVATTPSAAIRLAKRAGYPVEVKPWGPDVPLEVDGCPVERGLMTASDVRRACAAVTRTAGQASGAPVIVRETPPSGRELRARIAHIAELGLTVLVDIVGAPGPLAAPAPLRAIDAEEIARHVEASRLGDPQPDRAALADVLRRASFLVAASGRIVSLDLGRVIAAARGDGVLVADASTVLAD